MEAAYGVGVLAGGVVVVHGDGGAVPGDGVCVAVAFVEVGVGEL